MIEKVVQATIASLGHLEGGTYFPESDCLVGVNDLIRFLNQDGKSLDARRICLVNNIVRNDLVPILLSEDTNEKLFASALRLTANLCQPTIVAFGGRMPETDDVVQVYHDSEKHLVNTLAAFTKVQLFEKFADVLDSFFAKEWAERDEASKTNVDRIVILIRYIFAIGMECPMTVERPKIDPLVKERMIRAFLRSRMPSILMKVGSDRMEKDLSVHIMGIFSLLLRSIDCENVASFQAVKPLGEQEQEDEELRFMVERDRTRLKARRSQLSSSRNYLGAKYILKNAALNPANDLLIQKSDLNTSLDSIRPRKRNYRTTKRSRVRDIVESVFKPNTYAPADLCQLLHDFCKNFITNAFDKVMKATRDLAFIPHKAGGVLTYCDVNYFFLAEYVLQFIRIAKMPIEKASSVFSSEFFHHIVSQCENYFELMKTDKFSIKSTTVRAQHAISAYKEMMLLLISLAKSERFMDKEMFSYITQTIYYNEEYREFPHLVLNKLQPQGMTRKLLNDLIIASHYYIGTMDHIIKTGELQIVAKRKRIAKHRKKKVEQFNTEAEERETVDQMNEEQLNELWDQIKDDVRDVLSGVVEANEEISPINVLLKVDDDKHQSFAFLQIQRALRTRRVCDAVGLYKAARDLWPDAAFGDYSNTVDQDTPVLQEIYHMDLTDTAVEYDDLVKIAYEANVDQFAEDEHISVSDDEKKRSGEDSEGEEYQPKYKTAEINFHINDYIRNFTKPDIIHWYVFALSDFETNPVELNRAIVKMFYLIAFQLEMPSKLYLATLFRILERVNIEIQNLPKEVAKKHQFYDIYKFGYHLLQKFLGHFKERGPTLICDLLFSKSNRECMEIEYSHGVLE